MYNPLKKNRRHNIQKTSDMENDVKKVLEKMTDEMPGLVLSAVVLIDNGISVAELSTEAGIDATIASTYLANIVKSNLEAMKLFSGEQKTDSILITTDKNYFLVRHIPGQPFFHFVMTRKDAWLGRTRLVMEKYGQRILGVMQKK